MKQIIIMFCVFFLLYSCSKPGLTARQGEVVFLSGSATVLSNKDSSSKDLAIGNVIKEKDLIKTSENSFCEIQFPGIGLIRLEPQTSFLVNNVKSKEYGFFELTQGSIAAKIEKMSGSDKVLFKTQTAIAAIRGTELLIDSNQDSAVIAVNEGTVALYPPDAALSLEKSPIKAKTNPKIREALPELTQGQQATIDVTAFESFKGKIDGGKWPQETLATLGQIQTDRNLYDQTDLSAANASRMIFTDREKLEQQGQKNNTDSSGQLVLGFAQDSGPVDHWFANSGGKCWTITDEDPSLPVLNPQSVDGYAFDSGDVRLEQENGAFILNILKKGASFYNTGYNLDKAAPHLYANRIYELTLTMKASQNLNVIVKIGENNKDFNGDGNAFTPYLHDQPITLITEYKTYRFRFTTNQNDDSAPNFAIFTGHLDTGKISLKGCDIRDVGPAPSELPSNGKFTYGLMNWVAWEEANTKAVGRIFFTGSALGIECITPSSETWHYQVSTEIPFALKGGKTYEISFDAWGDAKDIYCAVCENGIDFNKDGLTYSPVLISPQFSPDSIPHRYTFTQTVSMNYPSVRFHFYNGNNKSILYVDNIMISEK